MKKIGQIITPSEIEFQGTQPIYNIEIIGEEAQTISDVLSGVESSKQGLVLPTEIENKKEWAEKAYISAVSSIAVLIALGKEGIFPKKEAT